MSNSVDFVTRDDPAVQQASEHQWGQHGISHDERQFTTAHFRPGPVVLSGAPLLDVSLPLMTDCPAA